MENATNAKDAEAMDDASTINEQSEQTSPKINLRDGLSIDEAKVSALIICTLGDFALVAWCIVVNGDISDNHLYLTQTLVAAVAGVNIAGQLAGFIKRKG